MSNFLYDAAMSFEYLRNHDFQFILGDRKRKIRISIISSDKLEFTHVVGLDHLKDVPSVIGKNSSQKKSIYSKIINREITDENILDSSYLYSPISKGMNPVTKDCYTIFDRIEHAAALHGYLLNGFKGKFYKWNRNKCRIQLPNGDICGTNIQADYLLVIPNEKVPHEKYYFFMYKTNRNASKEKPIELHIHSAFPETIDLAAGQEKPYTILQENQIHRETKVVQEIHTHPSYKNMQKPLLPIT